MDYHNSLMAIYNLEIALMAIRREKDNINRMRYNARFLKGPKTPELVVAEARRKELIVQEKETKLLLKLANPPRVVAQKTYNTKALGAARLDTLNDDACGICMELHTLRDSLHTSCGHCFGSACYGIYLEHAQAHEQRLQRYVQERPNAPHQNAIAHMLQVTRQYACPMCRTKNPSLTAYKERAKAVRKIKPIPIIPTI
jgi:hypothetical protein